MKKIIIIAIVILSTLLIAMSFLAVGQYLFQIQSTELSNLKHNTCEELKKYDSKGKYWSSENREYVEDKIDTCLANEKFELQLLDSLSCNELINKRSEGNGFLSKDNLYHVNSKIIECSKQKDAEFAALRERLFNAEDPEETMRIFEKCVSKGYTWTENNTCEFN